MEEERDTLGTVDVKEAVMSTGLNYEDGFDTRQWRKALCLQILSFAAPVFFRVVRYTHNFSNVS